ncbi:uncharacterized protein [Rutidosis leptorrhynchoides]|uniref:uncharacterized protein n=1 Tax=Rutidosis leptorrhynchoides TaxID=125765 RepID=UPI003A99DC6F
MVPIYLRQYGIDPGAHISPADANWNSFAYSVPESDSDLDAQHARSLDPEKREIHDKLLSIAEHKRAALKRNARFMVKHDRKKAKLYPERAERIKKMTLEEMKDYLASTESGRVRADVFMKWLDAMKMIEIAKSLNITVNYYLLGLQVERQRMEDADAELDKAFDELEAAKKAPADAPIETKRTIELSDHYNRSRYGDVLTRISNPSKIIKVRKGTKRAFSVSREGNVQERIDYTELRTLGFSEWMKILQYFIGKALLSHLSEIHGFNKDGGDSCLDNLQVASILAQFVSDHFGGSDRSAMIDRARKSLSGSNYNKPFVCTCPTGNNDNSMKYAKLSINASEDAVLFGLCEKSFQLVKTRTNSVIVPIGSLQFGVCRHRALLMKYLCDRVKPRVPCELVRGYLDFAPHAWNVVVVKRGDTEVKMVVDACRPHDIREETDLEYFYRYIPLNRINCDSSPDVDSSFPSLSAHEEIEEGGSTTLIRCNLKSVEAAAKVRTLEVSGSLADEVRNFEFNCLGEVRLLSVFKHPCIVKNLGHQISTKWVPSQNGTPDHRILQSAIYMEHVKGGSLKHYLEKLARSGKKHVPLDLALQIVKDIAWALSEVHSKEVIHRDLKSANILIDLDDKKSDELPIVKLCDFDRVVPLRSPLHTCCIGHMGIPPPDVCVGTPRWMAPEIYRTIHDPRLYGLEVDIWSFGCLLLELLTLRVPYAGLLESEIHELLFRGKRPVLTDELEAMGPGEDTDVAKSESKTEEYKKEKTMRFLIDIYRQCTKEDPSDRPTAEEIYQLLCDFSDSSSVQV